MKRKHAEAYQATSKDKKDADVTIWTDGSCVASQFGPGAWSFILKSDEKEIEASGYDHHTTVNRMEMMAAIEGLKRCPEGVAVLVISDSMLLVKCGSGEWRRKANLDLWSLLDEQMQNRSVVFRWVRGHNGDAMNERCDALCGQARRNEAGTIRVKEIRQPKLSKKLLDALDGLTAANEVTGDEELPPGEKTVEESGRDCLSDAFSGGVKWGKNYAYLDSVYQLASGMLCDPRIHEEPYLKDSIIRLKAASHESLSLCLELSRAESRRFYEKRGQNEARD